MRIALGDIVLVKPTTIRTNEQSNEVVADIVDWICIHPDRKMLGGRLLGESGIYLGEVDEKDVVEILRHTDKIPATPCFKHKIGDQISYKWDDENITSTIKDLWYAVEAEGPLVLRIETQAEHLLCEEDGDIPNISEEKA